MHCSTNAEQRYIHVESYLCGNVKLEEICDTWNVTYTLAVCILRDRNLYLSEQVPDVTRQLAEDHTICGDAHLRGRINAQIYRISCLLEYLCIVYLYPRRKMSTYLCMCNVYGAFHAKWTRLKPSFKIFLFIQAWYRWQQKITYTNFRIF